MQYINLGHLGFLKMLWFVLSDFRGIKNVTTFTYGLDWLIVSLCLVSREDVTRAPSCLDHYLLVAFRIC